MRELIEQMKNEISQGQRGKKNSKQENSQLIDCETQDGQAHCSAGM